MIRIVTDTACDITLEEAARLGVEIVPMRVLFGQAPYDQLEDQTFEAFYRLLESAKELPTTSQPSPEDYLRIFKDAKHKRDSVVVIALAGALSGAVQSATVAKNLAEYEAVYVADSKQAVIGQRLLVDYALALRDAGKSAAEIHALIQEASGKVVLYGALDTLRYLRKGGRIPKTAEVVGTVLGIKPIITLQDGAITMAGKARGHAGAVTTVIKLIDEGPEINRTTPVYYGYTLDEKHGRNFQKLAGARYKLQNTYLYPVGATVGTHIGPGAFAIAYLSK